MIEIRHKYIDQPLTSSPEHFSTLAVEHPKFLRHLLEELQNQIASDEGEFFYDFGGKESSLKKDCFLLTDPLQVIHDEKKEETSFTKEIASSLDEEGKASFEHLKSEIVEFTKNLSVYTPLPYSFQEDFTFQNFLKFVSVKPSLSEDSLLNKLISSIGVISHIFSKKILVICHLHAYLTAEEIDVLFSEMTKIDVGLINIEHHRPTQVAKDEKVVFVDGDLCEF